MWDLSTYKRKGPCSRVAQKLRCDFAHSLTGLKTPAGYVPLTARPHRAVGESFVCMDWGTGHSRDPSIELSWTDVYPTKMTYYMDEAPLELRRPQLCKHFFYLNEKCPHWHQCFFVHAKLEVVESKLRQFFCFIEQGGPSMCEYKKGCPFAHNLDQLNPPAAFCRPSPFAVEHGEKLFPILYAANKTFDLPAKYMADTPGAFAYDGSHILCDTSWYCHEEGCENLHILREGWRDTAVQFPKNLRAPAYFGLRPSRARPAFSWGRAAPASAGEAAHVAQAIEHFPALSASGGPQAIQAVPAVPPALQELGGIRNAGDEDDDDEEEYIERDTSDSGDASQVTLSGDGTHTSVAALIAETLAKVRAPPTFNAEPFDMPRMIDEDQAALWSPGCSGRWKNDMQQWLTHGTCVKAPEQPFFYNPRLTIAKESTAEVHLGMCVDGRQVAVKSYLTEVCDGPTQVATLKKSYDKEISIYLKHGGMPGVVGYVGSWTEIEKDKATYRDKINRFVVMELMEGTVVDVVNAWKDAQLIGTLVHYSTTRYVIGSVLRTLQRFNHHGREESLVHRDIKPANILFDSNGRVRLIDFGISAVLKKIQDQLTQSSGGSAGTLLYASPEALGDQKKAHRTSDIYSLGQVLRFMLSGKELKHFQTEMKDRSSLNMPDSWPKFRKDTCVDLLTVMLKAAPNDRAYFKMLSEARIKGALPEHMASPHVILLSHPFFWSARRMTAFLVSLGNFKRPIVPGIGEAALKAVPGDDWRRLFAADFPSVLEEYRPNDRNPGLSLLRFIRNKQVHCEDDPGDGASRVMGEPYFLKKLPEITVRCWHAIVKRLPDLQEPSVLDFVLTPFDPELGSLGKPDDPWL